MAAANMKRAGKVSDIEARAMVTLPSSSGCQCNNSYDRDSSGVVGAARVPTFSDLSAKPPGAACAFESIT
jgi:hypothetical protein